jgi:hypothetical protein
MKIGAITLVTSALMVVAASAIATNAMAQNAGGMGGERRHAQGQAKTAEPKPKVDEKAYTSALKGLPDKQYDAWHGVR